MKIELNKIPTSGLFIEEKIELNKELYDKAPIIDLKDVNIKGKINYDYENNLCLDLHCDGIFILEDAITLEPIKYPFSCEIEEKIEDVEEKWSLFYEKNKNTLDISEILWENIVLEIPISATNSSSDTLPIEGTGWERVNENKKKIDPRLEKLNELFKERKE